MAKKKAKKCWHLHIATVIVGVLLGYALKAHALKPVTTCQWPNTCSSI